MKQSFNCRFPGCISPFTTTQGRSAHERGHHKVDYSKNPPNQNGGGAPMPSEMDAMSHLLAAQKTLSERHGKLTAELEKLHDITSELQRVTDQQIVIQRAISQMDSPESVE